MELSELSVGTKLEIETFDINGEKMEPTLISEIEWIEGNNIAVIAAPILGGNIIPLPVDSVVNVYFVGTERGIIYNRYKFNAVVRERDVSNNLYVLKVEKRGKIEKDQRRRYFRLDCYAEVRYKEVESLNANKKDDGFKKTLIKNLSGGGICIKTDDRMKPGSIVICEMTINNRKIGFYGKVVRFEDTGREYGYRYEAGIAYMSIDERDREAIIRYIFNEQRKLLNKGLVF
jgi:c-di-GMP-binding flagellar brake protein YcgR